MLNNYGWISPDPELVHGYVIPSILHLLPQGEKIKILDAGCGNGYLAGRLSKLGYEVTGIDIARDGILIAQKTYPFIKFNIASVYDDLTDIVKTVDVVISSEVIEHLYDPRRFLENMHGLISPGGCIVLTTPYHGYLKNLALSIFNAWDKHHTVAWEGGHIKFFSERTLAKMLIETGYKNIKFKNAGRIPYLWKSMVCRAIKNA